MTDTAVEPAAAEVGDWLSRFQDALTGTSHARIEEGLLKFYGATGKPLTTDITRDGAYMPQPVISAFVISVLLGAVRRRSSGVDLEQRLHVPGLDPRRAPGRDATEWPSRCATRPSGSADGCAPSTDRPASPDRCG